MTTPLFGAERFFDFSKFEPNQPPPGFHSTVTGRGKPGDWKIILEDVPPTLPPLSPNAPSVTKRPVLAQLARDPVDEHFPVLVFDEDVYEDFTLTTRFKTVAGTVEQMAGIVFRYQDEKNYYVVRASSMGNTFRFYKFVDGVRSDPIGPKIEIPGNTWQEMSVECKGNQIHVFLNGKEAMPMMTDSSFMRGKIGFWTKSDAVSYFVDAKIVYKPIETLATVLVRDTLRRYPRLLGLRIYAKTERRQELHVVAADKPEDLGTAGGTVEEEVIQKDGLAYGKTSKSVVVTLPLHDRNGEPYACVRITMATFPGQTENNAIARATPIIKSMETRSRLPKDLTE
ncbi:MAG TPA: family 16 glycoside hydrolase [Verrucomicrobiae bacterium]|nr:family 16 glycoside hydrolase [Verrucomicrobiae bacterium]